MRIFVNVCLQRGNGFLIVLRQENLLGGIEENAFPILFRRLFSGQCLEVSEILFRLLPCLVNGLDGTQGILRILRSRHFRNHFLIIAQCLVVLGFIGRNHAQADKRAGAVSRVAAFICDTRENLRGLRIAADMHVSASEFIFRLAPECGRNRRRQCSRKQLRFFFLLVCQCIRESGLVIWIKVIQLRIFRDDGFVRLDRRRIVLADEIGISFSGQCVPASFLVSGLKIDVEPFLRTRIISRLIVAICHVIRKKSAFLTAVKC